MQSTYTSTHGAGPGHAGAGATAGPSHGLGLGLTMDDMTNGGVAMDVFDQELNFDKSLL